jgi:hypothetical protein
MKQLNMYCAKAIEHGFRLIEHDIRHDLWELGHNADSVLVTFVHHADGHGFRNNTPQDWQLTVYDNSTPKGAEGFTGFGRNVEEAFLAVLTKMEVASKEEGSK